MGLPSPVRPDNTAMAALTQQLTEAEDRNAQLQRELYSLRDKQAHMMEETRNAVARTYQDQMATQMATMQQKLTDSHRSMEKQISEMKSRHASELESVRKQEEAAREADLQERDRHHVTLVERLTAELTTLQEGVERDADEQEAMRMRVIKEGMKDMHEKDKARLAKEHQDEKARLAKDHESAKAQLVKNYEEEKAQLANNHETEKLRLSQEHQQQMEAYMKQVQDMANSQMAEYYKQFKDAYDTLAQQKTAVESDLLGVTEELQLVSSQLGEVGQEKERLEWEHRRLLETHSAEVEEMNTTARNLEERVNSWKDKAAGLETRLRHSGQTQENLGHLKEEYEAKLQGLSKQIAGLESDLKEQKERNETVEEQLQRAEEDAHTRHQQELDELKSQHGSEVELLEKSISEAQSDKASLEAAEEHMSGLQKQLKAYRMQESEIDRLKEEQAQVADLLKQRREKEKADTLTSLRAEFTSQIERLQRELAAARENTELDVSYATVEELYSRQEEELAQLRATLQETHAKALEALQTELKRGHLTDIEALKQQHERDVEQLKLELQSASEQVSRIEAESKAKLAEFKESHGAEYSQLQSQHDQTIRELQQLLEEQQRIDAVGEASRSKIAELESELQESRQREAEWGEQQRDMMSRLEGSQREIERGEKLLTEAQSTETLLRERNVELSGHLQSVESDCHVAQSARATTQQFLEETQGQVEELKGQLEYLQEEVREAETAKTLSREQGERLLQLTNQLAEKNVAIANLQSETDTLNTEVFGLTRKCQQQTSAIELLQRQLENAGAVSEEIAALQQQLSELAPVKKHNDVLRQTVTQLETAVQSKDGAIHELQSSLEQLQGQLAGMEAAVQSKDGTICELQSSLEGQLASRDAAIQFKDRTIGELQSSLEQLQGQLAGMEAAVQSKDWTIRELQSSLEQLQGQLAGMEAAVQSKDGTIRELQSSLEQLQGQLAGMEAAVQSRDGTIRELQSSLEQLQGQLAGLEAAVQSKDRELGQLQMQLVGHNALREETEQLRASSQAKDMEIQSLREDLNQADLHMRELRTEWETKLDEKTRDSSREIEALKAELESVGEREKVLQRQLKEQKDQLESTLTGQQEELSRAEQEMSRLQTQLRESQAANTQLEREKQSLSAELRALQEQSESVLSDSLAEMRSKNEELEQSLTALELEKERLAAELAQSEEEREAQVEESKKTREAKVGELEQNIENLQRQLNEKDVEFAEMQTKLTQKLAEAEAKQHQSLLDDSSQLRSHESVLVGGRRSALEESLSRARRRLSEKLREKETLERDLGFHRTELERRLGEKQRLEELLFEKTRFEQELVNQKEQLQADMMQIESKLHLHGGRGGQPYSNHMVTSPNQSLLTHS